MARVPNATEDEGARTRTPTIRVSDSEDARIEAAAKRSGHTKAKYMRLAVMAAVEESEAEAAAKRKGKANR